MVVEVLTEDSPEEQAVPAPHQNPELTAPVSGREVTMTSRCKNQWGLWLRETKCFWSPRSFLFFFFKIIYLFLEGKKGRQTLMCGCLSHAPIWRPGMCNLGMCPDWKWNWRPLVSRPAFSLLSHTSQGQAVPLKGPMHRQTDLLPLHSNVGAVA